MCSNGKVVCTGCLAGAPKVQAGRLLRVSEPQAGTKGQAVASHLVCDNKTRLLQSLRVHGGGEWEMSQRRVTKRRPGLRGPGSSVFGDVLE